MAVIEEVRADPWVLDSSDRNALGSGAKGRPDVLEILVEEAALDVPLDDARFEIPR